jgi:hypothetical protein
MQPTVPFRRWPLKSDADGHAAIEIEETAKMQLQANAPQPLTSKIKDGPLCGSGYRERRCSLRSRCSDQPVQRGIIMGRIVMKGHEVLSPR